MKSASRSVAWEQVLPRAALLLVSLLAAAPLWGPGLLNTRGGGDSPFLLLRTHQLAVNLRAGVFPVRWMPDAAYGLGYPFFSYYASLPYYIAAGFDILGLDILTAIKLTQTLFLAAAALGMYRWAARALDSRPGGWLAAVAYTVTPFHLVNLYVRGDSLSEFAAFTFFPLILWGVDRLAARPSLRRSIMPALAYAGLILTHNVSALIFSPFLLLYIVFHVARMAFLRPNRPLRETIDRYSVFAVPLLGGLLLSAWFWLPALAETQHVQLTAQTTGYFFYGNHFRGADLMQGKLLFDYATGRDGSTPFAMGLVQAFLALAGGLVVVYSLLRPRLFPRHKTLGHTESRPKPEPSRLPTEGFALLGLLIVTWLMTPLSRWLWDHIPLLPMVQFPWRFLSVQALFTAFITGAALSHLRAQWRLPAWVSALALGALLVTTALIGVEPEYLSIAADDVTVERLQLYEVFTGNIGSTIRHEYLPRWVKPRPYIGPEQFSPDTPPRAIPVNGGLVSAERLEREPTRRLWRVEAGDAGVEVAFPLHYWPGWQATVDETEVNTEPAVGSGYLTLDVPPGAHLVEIRLGRTPLRLAAEVASLAASLGVLILPVAAWYRGRGRGNQANGGFERMKSASAAPPYQIAISYVPFILLLSLFAAFHPRISVRNERALTMDFEKMPYLHHNPDGVALDGWRLMGYRYESPSTASPRKVAPGQDLQLILNWRRDDESSVSSSPGEPVKLRFVSPAAVRYDRTPPAAEAAAELGDQQASPGKMSTVVTLSVPQETPPGMYLLEIIDEPSVYLKPVWVAYGETTSEKPVQAAFADGALQLQDVRATQPAPDRLNVQLDWTAAAPVAANYGLSLSLTDPAGNEWLYQDGRPGYDTQPGRGFLPTSLWPLNRVMEDQHVPRIQPGVPPGDSYLLTVDLYQVATLESVGEVITTIALTEVSERPDAPIEARFGEELELNHVDLPTSIRQGERLATTAHWSVARNPSENYVVEYQLEGAGERIAVTQPMAPGSHPKDWPAGAWIAGRAVLPISPTIPPGEYAVSLALKEPESGTIVGTYTHPAPLTIRGQARVWELPELEERVEVQFGNMIELAGYDLTESEEKLRLTLHWQALTTPDRHYMFFVHLADPETGNPATQVDTMPHQFNYPTGQWAPGEVVSDVVEISTKDVAPGPYVLAVGWYDPDTKQRLPALDSEGTRLSDDRLVLPSSITLDPGRH